MEILLLALILLLIVVTVLETVKVYDFNQERAKEQTFEISLEAVKKDNKNRRS